MEEKHTISDFLDKKKKYWNIFLANSTHLDS